jgi:hypothetical protein
VSGRGWLAPAAVLLAVAGPAAAQPAAPEDGLPAVEGASVELSWTEVRALIEQLTMFRAQGDDVRNRPPVDALIHSAALRLTLGDGVMLVDGTVDVEVLREGWTIVPLFDGPLALRGVAVVGEGEAARVSQTARGAPGLLLRQAGVHRVSLSYAVAVDARMGPKSVAVPMPLAAAVEATLVVDGRVEDVTAQGAVLVRSAVLRAARGDESAVTQHVLAVHAPREFVLQFVARRPLSGVQPLAMEPVPGSDVPGSATGPGEALPPPPPPKPARYRSTAALDVAVEPAAVRTTVRLELTIHDAPLEQVELDPLPEWELVKALLEGSDEPLRVEAAAEGLVVRFPYPVEERAVVTLLLERTNERKLERAAAPAVVVHGAYRQEGEIGFRLDSTIEGSADEVEGGSAADPSEVRLPGGAVAQFAFRFHRVPYAVGMALRYHEPRAVLTAAVERALIRVVATADGKTVVDAAWRMLNSRHSYLAVTLPAGVEPWGAFIDGRPVQIGQRTDRPQVALIALPRPEQAPGIPAPFTVELIYYAKREPFDDFADWSLELPRVDVPVAVLDVETWLPPTMDYRAGEGPLQLVGTVVELTVDDWRAGNYRDETVQTKSGEWENSKLGSLEDLARGTLAARFELPREGTLLSWHGAIFDADEGVSLTLGTRPRWFDRLAWWGSAALLLVGGGLLALGFGAWAAGSRRRGLLLLVAAAVAAGGVVGGSLFVPVAGAYAAFVGFAVTGMAVGATNLFRWIAARRRVTA